MAPRGTFALILALFPATVAGLSDLTIVTAHDSERENATRAQLVRLLGKYDVEKWLFTRSVVIDETAIPHSHPVLTLHTRHAEDERLLATFVHEEIHWHLEAKDEKTRLAIAELMQMHPTAPTGGGEGAADAQSTYLHLIVNYLELQAMQELVGDQRARRVFEFWATDHYKWIYRTVLADELEIGQVVARHELGI